MDDFRCVTLRQQPQQRAAAAAWFHQKWHVPEEAYLRCMDEYLNGRTPYGWYLCLDGDRIIGGLGVIENDFHNRKDLPPNICAVYTEANTATGALRDGCCRWRWTTCAPRGSPRCT